mmetsp:Transcript_66512/g.195125  ORF Transcript_66512/g.195125 Transcript_66512/m.195125 type:complete len:255 (-) Transcript_66512:453-1217(-)
MSTPQRLACGPQREGRTGRAARGWCSLGSGLTCCRVPRYRPTESRASWHIACMMNARWSLTCRRSSTQGSMMSSPMLVSRQRPLQCLCPWPRGSSGTTSVVLTKRAMVHWPWAASRLASLSRSCANLASPTLGWPVVTRHTLCGEFRKSNFLKMYATACVASAPPKPWPVTISWIGSDVCRCGRTHLSMSSKEGRKASYITSLTNGLATSIPMPQARRLWRPRCCRPASLTGSNGTQSPPSAALSRRSAALELP